jgi:prolyl-tRNA synthetase
LDRLFKYLFYGNKKTYHQKKAFKKEKRQSNFKRNNGEKVKVEFRDLCKKVSELLKEMQSELYDSAKNLLDSRMKDACSISDAVELVKNKNMVRIPFCKCVKCEEKLKEIMPGMKSLFICSEKKVSDKEKCLICGKNAEYYLWIGKTY